MFSGKTTELRKKLSVHKFAGHSCYLIKSAVDTRHVSDVKTHAGDGVKADRVCRTLSEVTDEDVARVDVIGIDEGQFFPDLMTRCERFASLGKIVYVAALRSRADGSAFAPVAELWPRVERIHDMQAVCLPCGNGAKSRASFTIAIGGRPTGDVLIGGAETYVAVCRSCRDRLRAESTLPEPRPAVPTPDPSFQLTIT